ncbi:glycosyltransferase [Natronoarchaeum rubrum]|uniref:glycosyltransferase n=1 Tax=Natronoarchaeum rubrum TaxID=755311 RepID=UPI0021125020|nr:glycosyltransferase [Natronoarchaeum rubrum]
MSLKVLHLTNNLKSGAIPHTIVDLTRGFSDDVDVFAGGLLAGDDSRVDDEVIAELETVGATPIRFEFDTKPTRVALRDLHQTLTDVDVLNTHLVRSGVIGRIVGTIARTPCIVSTEQSVHAKDQYNRKQLFLNQATLPLADHVVPISSAVEQSFSRWTRVTCPSERRTIIHNPIDTEAIVERRGEPLPDEIARFVASASPVVGCVGRLERVKNQDLLLEAIATLSDRYPDIGLLLVGDGSREAALRNRATELGIEDAVLFTGRIERKSVYALLHELDVFALASLHEGQGVALCEAMAAGTPVVASKIPAFEEILGETEYLVDFEVDSWERGICAAIHDNEIGDDLQKIAKNRFSYESVSQPYVSIYMDELST